MPWDRAISPRLAFRSSPDDSLSRPTTLPRRRSPSSTKRSRGCTARGSDLLGARIGVTSPDYTIVGIVKDARYSHLRETPTAVWYVPCEQQPNVKYLDMHIRTAGAPAEMIGSVRAAIASIDPGVALFEVRPLQAQVDRLLVVERMLSALSVFFGSAGAILAGLGLSAW